MRAKILYVLCCAVAALVPLLPEASPAPAPHDAFPGWPEEVEGRPIRALPASQLDGRWSADLPGRLARFTDGEREIVIRWIATSTRKFHPAASCFQGLGYSIRRLPDEADARGMRWGAFEATRGSERLFVRERIHDDRGRGWTDASDWYWDALFGKTEGPWWSVTIAERRRGDREIGR